MKKKIMDVIVVGGGAAGLMAAVTAARTGCSVLILEHNNMAGKKILATGNGRCNFTNTVQGVQFYRSDSPAFVLPSLTQFSADDAICFFQELGVMTTEKNGYCYPRTMQASAVRNALLKEVERLHISICADIGIRRIYKEKDHFVFETKSGIFFGKTCILATGGKAEPKSGSDGSGYIYAKQLGHHTTEILPALVPLIADTSWLKDVKGVRQDGTVSLFVDGRFLASDRGEIQFTEYGISGIPAFQISRFAAKALAEHKRVQVSVDFVPDLSGEELLLWLDRQIHLFWEKGILWDILSGIVNQKIAHILIPQLPFKDRAFRELSKKQLHLLTEQTVLLLKETTLDIVGTKSFQQAQVTAGGICTEEIHSETMESKLVKGLYFAGEIIDVDGMCGGYNLQWAWSSGYLAGKSAAKTAEAGASPADRQE